MIGDRESIKSGRQMAGLMHPVRVSYAKAQMRKACWRPMLNS